MSAFGSRGVSLRTSALLGASILTLCLMGHAAGAQETAYKFDIPQQPLSEALRAYARVAGDQIIFDNDQVRGRTATLHGTYTADEALTKILNGSHLAARRLAPNEVMVGPAPKQSSSDEEPVVHLADAVTPAHAAAGIESVVVTSSKIKGDIQTVPIAITALSQEQLTSRQIAGGPDLVKEVPNLTFTKTNFSGYSIQIRGIGTQAISVTTDPAVAVAFNDIPFIRNHFFEQEFYDVGQVEVLRGPQGTLYGRNATAGVVNVISAKPTDQFEAMLSADWGNYSNRRYEGMVNIPVVDDRLDLRVAAEWTKRDGYSTNEITGSPIDGRDLWSSRVTLGWKPASNVQAYLVWEHFQENDDRLRSGKQLCDTDTPPTTVDGVPIPTPRGGLAVQLLGGEYLSQGCKADGLYDQGNPNGTPPSYGSFGVPYGFALPYVLALQAINGANPNVDPYASARQSTNLRVIESTLTPQYRAKNDTLELNTDYAVTPALTFTSQTGYNQDFLWSTEDYNRFDTSPGIFENNGQDEGSLKDSYYFRPDPAAGANGVPADTVIFCDPQLGCSDRLVGEDLSEEHAWQLSQEFRLASNFSGPLNFSVGGNYMHYETEENYYVFINALTRYSVSQDQSGDRSTLDNSDCLNHAPTAQGYQNPNPAGKPGSPTQGCVFIDLNPIGSLNNYGHNYFLSQNPYVLNSYAGFGEVYYNVLSDLKLIGGLRWTEDKKRFIDIPSEVITDGYGYPVIGTIDQQWDQLTGRATANWTPKLDFTDQTLVYGSFAHGYKAGGANPPGAILISLGRGSGEIDEPDHPKTFNPEFIDAYELGTKNTLLDGALTLNGDVFFYNYKGYQISEIVDRTAINLNFNATVKGAELETSWEPAPGLKFSFAGGYEDTRIGNGQSTIDLIDRTAGTPGWMVVKPFPTQASNCILPDYVVAALMIEASDPSDARYASQACGTAYSSHLDPVTLYSYQANPTGTAAIGYCLTCSGNDGNVTYPIPAGYAGFDPLSVDPNAPAGVNNGLGLPPNNGEGFSKNVGGNQLPNAPHFTTSLTAEYTMPVSEDWAATLHSDFYWQSQSFARVLNDRPYDKIRGYSNVNLALILTSASGWQVLGYLKNVFNTTAITGDFLNSDDSGLTTNVFLTDPRLFGVRVTKNF